MKSHINSSKRNASWYQTLYNMEGSDGRKLTETLTHGEKNK